MIMLSGYAVMSPRFSPVPQERLLTSKEAITARKQALSKLDVANEDDTSLSYYIDESHATPKQFEVITFLDDFNNRRVFAIDRSTQLGEGAQGEVYLAQELLEDKKLNAQKASLSIVKLSDAEFRFADYENEFEILKHLNQNPAKCIHASGPLKTTYLFAPYHQGINLQDVCYYKINNQLVKKPLNPLLIIQLLRGILAEVHYLHQSYGVLHRDLKINNFMVIDGEPPIIRAIDFGTSCLIQQSDKTFCGTIGYQAPDLTLPANQHAIYNIQHDYYSIGVIFAEIVATENYQHYIAEKMRTFSSSDTLGIFQRKDLKQCMPSVFSEQRADNRYPGFQVIKDIINILTTKDPFKRPTFQDVEKMIRRLSTLEQDYLQANASSPNPLTPREKSSPRLAPTSSFNGFPKEELTRQLEALTTELKRLDFTDKSSEEGSPVQIHFSLNFSKAPKRERKAETEAPSSSGDIPLKKAHSRMRSNSDIPKLNLKEISESLERGSKSSGSRHRKFSVTPKVSPTITDTVTEPQISLREFLTDEEDAHKDKKSKLQQ